MGGAVLHHRENLTKCIRFLFASYWLLAISGQLGPRWLHSFGSWADWCRRAFMAIGSSRGKTQIKALDDWNAKIRKGLTCTRAVNIIISHSIAVFLSALTVQLAAHVRWLGKVEKLGWGCRYTSRMDRQMWCLALFTTIEGHHCNHTKLYDLYDPFLLKSSSLLYSSKTVFILCRNLYC